MVLMNIYSLNQCKRHHRGARTALLGPRQYHQLPHLTFNAINVVFIYKIQNSVNTGNDNSSLTFLTSNPSLARHVIFVWFLLGLEHQKQLCYPNAEIGEAGVSGRLCLSNRSRFPQRTVCPQIRITNLALLLLGPCKRILVHFCYITRKLELKIQPHL